MKAIMLSVRPNWTAKILNGEKTIEVRKKFPADYVGWVYIYCTKGKPELNYHSSTQIILGETDLTSYRLNGKVVARFWCDNVTEYINGGQWHDDDTFGRYDDYIKDNILEQSCLTEEELFDYCEDLAFSAIHISKLEIFDETKELSEFHSIGYEEQYDILWNNCCTDRNSFERLNENYQIKKAPQNYCFLEVE